MKPSTSTTSAMLPFALALILAVPATFAQFFDPSGALQPPPPPALHIQQLPTITFPATAVASAPERQAFVQPQVPVQLQVQAQPSKPQLAHHAVLRNSADEERLPEELRNSFYKNPRLADALAKASWFVPGEEHVLEREAEKIPRDQVVKLLKNAGLVRRR